MIETKEKEPPLPKKKKPKTKTNKKRRNHTRKWTVERPARSMKRQPIYDCRFRSTENRSTADGRNNCGSASFQWKFAFFSTEKILASFPHRYVPQGRPKKHFESRFCFGTLMEMCLQKRKTFQSFPPRKIPQDRP